MCSLNNKTSLFPPPGLREGTSPALENGTFGLLLFRCWAPLPLRWLCGPRAGRALELVSSGLVAFSSYLVCTTNHSIFCTCSDLEKVGKALEGLLCVLLGDIPSPLSHETFSWIWLLTFHCFLHSFSTYVYMYPQNILFSFASFWTFIS